MKDVPQNSLSRIYIYIMLVGYWEVSRHVTGVYEVHTLTSSYNRYTECRENGLFQVGGSVVEYSPVTRAVRVRFPADKDWGRGWLSQALNWLLTMNTSRNTPKRPASHCFYWGSPTYRILMVHPLKCRDESAFRRVISSRELTKPSFQTNPRGHTKQAAKCSPVPAKKGVWSIQDV